MAAGGFCRAFNLSKFSRVILYLSLSGSALLSFAALAAQQIANSEVSLSILDPRTPTSLKNNMGSVLPRERENLLLKAELPEGIDLPLHALKWRIKDSQGLSLKELQGQDQAVQLATGQYQIELSIGQFISTKSLEVKTEVLSQPYFKADIGHLVIEANHVADWSITSLSQPHTSFDVKASQQVDSWVASGFYEITPVHSGVTRRQVVNVLAGEINTVSIDLPLVEVNLIAVQNNQPLFKPVEWEVFRLDKGERHYLGSYYQHSQGITVPAGYYEVVATHASTVRSRQFWVKENTSNRVILAMD
ncbi:MAG: hypothetical protein E6Q83_11345 [Thiothrix sp.]|nr:MAG: hypothetical protein E6Q83_11345 [Thiothrix sp.]